MYFLQVGLINKRTFSQLKNQSSPGEINYIQGQFTENNKIREYFYFLDHQGQVSHQKKIIKNELIILL